MGGTRMRGALLPGAQECFLVRGSVPWAQGQCCSVLDRAAFNAALWVYGPLSTAAGAWPGRGRSALHDASLCWLHSNRPMRRRPCSVLYGGTHSSGN